MTSMWSKRWQATRESTWSACVATWPIRQRWTLSPANRELEAAESWRSWLVSGSNAGAADPRRLRGAHRGLKRMLIEGVANGGPQPESWRHFSGAMVRLAINEALNSLPSDQNRVV